MDSPMHWVGTGGGPLIVIPIEIAQYWRGDVVDWQPESSFSELLESVMANSDYGRACSVRGYLGSLRIGPGNGLVLHDENMPTAFVPTHKGGLLVRWDYAENEEGVRKALHSTPESIWQETEHTLEVAEGRLLIFDSAYPGESLPNTCGDGANVAYLEVVMPPGTYEVDTAEYEPEESTRLVVHRLRRCRSADSKNPSGT